MKMITNRILTSIALVLLAGANAFNRPALAEEMRTTGESLRSSASPEKNRTEKVQQLITQLGSTRYVERRAAEQELLAIGLDAFDQLLAGTKSIDPEIAASCEYLLGEITVRWDRRDDPSSVREILQTYGSYPDPNDRLQLLWELARLPNGEGLSALCRICRYDSSDEVSLQAARYVLRPDTLTPELPPQASELIAAEIGDSPRPGGEWLRLFARQLRDGTSAIPDWKAVLDRTSEESKSRSEGDLQRASLLWNLLRLQLTVARDEPVEETVLQILAVRPEYSAQDLTRSVQWTAEAENWPALERVLGKFKEQLASTKQGAYAIARARQAQGREDLAEQAAEAAFGLTPKMSNEGMDERVALGIELMREGLVDWGRREIRAVVDEQPVISPTSVISRWALFDSLFDRQEYDEAAELLSALTSKIGESAASRREYRMLQQRPTRFVPAVETLRSREAFARACSARLKGDSVAEINLLSEAIAADPTDADVLIALYRAPGASSDQREKTLKLIDELSRAFLQEIESNPDDATGYNQWAWLISNTVGDYDKAIRFSLRSLELQPNDAGYLDTLGRCYFAAGDLENAVKTQRHAVSLQPHMEVMQRQLKQFEQSLAAKKNRQQAAGSGQ